MAESTEEKDLEKEEEDVEAESEEDEEEKDSGEEKDGEDDAPPVRKSADFFIGKRLGKREAKKESSSEESGLSPKAREAIRQELSPIVDSLKKQSDDIEIREYLSAHPNMRKHESVIRKRAAAWGNVPIAEIGKTIGASEEDLDEREDRRKEAQAKARGKRLAGTSGGAEEPHLPTTREEQAAMYKRVKEGRETIDLTKLG